jgi:hypothetical protein
MHLCIADNGATILHYKNIELSCENINLKVRFVSERNDIPQFYIDIYQ